MEIGTPSKGLPVYRFVLFALLVGAPGVAWSQDASAKEAVPVDPPAAEAQPAKAAKVSTEAVPKVPEKSIAPAEKAKIERALKAKKPIKVTPEALGVPPQQPANMEPKAVSSPGTDVEVSGYLRARYGAILDGDGNPDFVGSNDGFFLDNARLTVDANRGRAQIRIAIDGAVDRRVARNTAQGQVDVGLKDAYIAYDLADAVDFVIGQFKPPFDAEEQQATLDMTFITRAVESRGVHGTEGYNIDGLSLDRQAGLMLRGDLLPGDDMALRWALAATNGSGANRPTNDNDRLAYTGRLAFELGALALGGAVNFNEATTGVPPDLLADERLSIAADLAWGLSIGAYSVDMAAQFIRRQTTSKDVPAEPETVSQGYHASIGMGRGALYLAYRFASLDPTAEFDTPDSATQEALDADAVTYHTIGLNWVPADALCGLKLNYTITGEQAPRELSNDRLDVLVQAGF